VLASTHACITAANALVNYSGYVPQRPEISHCPHGKLTICSLFAGRRCLRLFRHCHDNVFLNLQEYSFLNLCARSSSKVSHRPDGNALLTCISTLAVRLGSNLVLPGTCTCQPRLCKMPIAPMGDSRFARCLQGGGVYVYGGTVSIVNSQIYSNTASIVRADVQNFPSPQWDALLWCPPL
jgi:hypothetical protein